MESLTSVAAGRPWPLGARWDGRGVNFAVFSAHAQSIELCLFDDSGRHELSRTALPGHTQDVWHGWIPGAAPGLVYGLRAHGPWRPDRGHRFNPHKLLLDPWAREIIGNFEWRAEHFGADPSHPHHMDTRDNAAHALKSRVVDARFDWGVDERPHTPLAKTVLYELHVKGFTKTHPGVPEALRGTFAGLASDAALSHLTRLGVTAVSLLPVQQHIDEHRLVRQGLTNYWGYNTIGFFCPNPRLSCGGGTGSARDEFRTMVRRLHAAGIEVILDVVFNHTCEGAEPGPTLSWRGLDNASWYRLPHDRPDRYENYSGCGNTLDLRHPRVLQFVMDCLRFWAQEMHVDGFRFDLAPVLGRGDHGFDPHGAFFKTVAQDPVLAGVKLIAEPWDIGPGGYQMGGFPRGWLEWNDRFRDTMRNWWLRGMGTRGEFAQRLCASSDVFHRQHRAPHESVNYVVAHDGFTLRDLVSYEHRHNEANGEGNHDGHAHNLSCNFGVEGATERADVIAVRERVQRAMLASLLWSQGTPMLAAGDELGHSQGGNNNPYCQDNSTSWIDWSRADAALIELTARLLRLRRERRLFDDHWHTGLPDTRGVNDLQWLGADGQALQGDAWQRHDDHCLGALLGRSGRRARADDGPLLLLVNGAAQERVFALPSGRWHVLLDSTHADGTPATLLHDVPDHYPLPARSVTLLARRRSNPFAATDSGRGTL